MAAGNGMMNLKKINQMPLQVEQIKAILKSGGKKEEVNRAHNQELRLRLHSETTLTQSETSRAVTMFLEYVRGLIPKDKFRSFSALFSYPVKTVSFVDKVYGALFKIFDGKNPVFEYEFRNPEAHADWEIYKDEKLDDARIWKTKGFEALRSRINSIAIVDLPAEQLTTNPEPYWYLLDVTNVIDLSGKENGEIDWIIFRQEVEIEGVMKKVIAVFDEVSYRIFSVPETNTYDIGVVLLETSHGLGYCPARFFWDMPLNYSRPFVRKSPLSGLLSLLDWLLFSEVSRNHLNLYASYPIYWSFAEDCDFENDIQGQYCKDGYLQDRDGNYILRSTGSLQQCPKCGPKNLAGPGSHIKVDPPGPDNNNADLRDPVSIVTIDKGALDYNVEEVQRLREEIFSCVVGNVIDPLSTQAINEKQVLSFFESRGDVLKQLKGSFETIQQWVNDTICRLRYGEQYIGSSINYGTEFFLISSDMLLSMYERARAANMGSQVLDMIQDKYFETKYKNNPEQLKRVRVEMNLQPFRHLTNEEVRGMYAANQIKFEDYYIKVNFSSLLMRFERENLNILEFGSGVSFEKKINSIQKVFISYAEEARPVAVQQPFAQNQFNGS